LETLKKAYYLRIHTKYCVGYIIHLKNIILLVFFEMKSSMMSSYPIFFSISLSTASTTNALSLSYVIVDRKHDFNCFNLEKTPLN
jgi:hypothetical protein